MRYRNDDPPDVQEPPDDFCAHCGEPLSEDGTGEESHPGFCSLGCESNYVVAGQKNEQARYEFEMQSVNAKKR